MDKRQHRMICPGCRTESWVRREPQYEGFRKTGERLSCAACGHRFESEAEIPYAGRQAPRVFRDEDKPRPLQVFQDSERGHTCRHCGHYVVNPFVQRCGLHFREVQATDTCDDFTPKPAEPETGDETKT